MAGILQNNVAKACCSAIAVKEIFCEALEIPRMIPGTGTGKSPGTIQGEKYREHQPTPPRREALPFYRFSTDCKVCAYNSITR